MFVAGIELFFGFVAGAILLVIGISALTVGGYICGAILKQIADLGGKIQKAVSHRPGTFLGTVSYLLLMLVLFNSSSDFMQRIASGMLLAGLIGILVAYVRWLNVKSRGTHRSPSKRRFWRTP